MATISDDKSRWFVRKRKAILHKNMQKDKCEAKNNKIKINMYQNNEKKSRQCLCYDESGIY